MIKVIFGAFAGAIAMFVVGFIFFATPLQFLGGAASMTPAQQATLQAGLAQNLPDTGTYTVPDPSGQEGAILYSKGPIATIHFNSKGFSPEDPSTMIMGFVHEFIVCLLIGFALMKLDRRVPDFPSRARIVIFFSLAGAALINLGEPIWYHHDWRHFIYEFLGNSAMLIAGGLVIARWFLPVGAVVSDAPVNSAPIPPAQVAASDPA